MWDAIRASHPGLIIDDCSSGGRRIDLETLSRSVPLWRSDNAGDAVRTGRGVAYAELNMGRVAYALSKALPNVLPMVRSPAVRLLILLALCRLGW